MRVLEENKKLLIEADRRWVVRLDKLEREGEISFYSLGKFFMEYNTI